MEKIYIFNTLGKEKQEFEPLNKDEVLFYHCGPTVYWTQHIGNLRGMFCGDVVRRTLEYNGYKVKYVRNYTDVGHLTSDGDEGEDKMEKGAKREGKTPAEIADKYIKTFEEDVKALNLLEPTFKPRATEYIKEMQEMVKTLLEKGFAYQTELAIYFDVSKAKDYTKLSGQKLEENKTGAGKGEVEDPDKKSPYDFAIWFFKKGTHAKAVQTWDLDGFGEGFPGWHMECSAMSKKLLGDTVDIHMGGIEHIPVHHTNEIAQSEAATGKKYVNYWLHNEHLLVNDRKMAKSEGTGYSMVEIKDRGFKPLSLRYFFLSAGYRAKQNFTWQALDASQNGLEGIYNKVRELGSMVGQVNGVFKKKFIKELNDDFNTPKALAILAEVFRSDLKNEDKLATVLDLDRVLGLDIKEQVAKSKLQMPEEIQLLINRRKEARERKDWAGSDKLRDEIQAMGYVVEDSNNEMKVYKK